MYTWVLILLILNVSLFSVNWLLPAPGPSQPPLTESDIPALELVNDVAPVVYTSAVSSSSSCYTIGPYSSRRAAELMMAKIRNYGLGVSMRSLQTLETLNYLVYIPPLTSRAEAEAVVKDMGRFDVQEHLVIDAGPYQNAISLGFFDDLNKAIRHAEYIRYLGYDARYTEQKAAREVFWLDYDEPFGANTPVKVWSESVDATSRVQVIPRRCGT